MDRRNIEFLPRCLAVGFKRKCNSVKYISGDELFSSFVNINDYSYWNINLKEIFDSCELIGHIRPYCLLISAPDISIQSLKVSHEKRLLKAPESFVIHFIGDVDPVNCHSILPSQFVSLDEALCYVIFDLNRRGETSTFDIICCCLAEWYPGIQLPPHFLILATLRNLIDAGQVYYTGYGYNIMTTDRLSISKWLDEPGPEKTDIQSGGKSERYNDTNITKYMDGMPILRTSQSSTVLMVPSDEAIKTNKSRSSLWKFFAKLRPHNRKARISTMSTTPSNNAANRGEPTYYSSNVDFFARDNILQPVESTQPQWFWHTSLQSLPTKLDTMIRSSSIHSRLSTEAVNNEPTAHAAANRQSHKFKSRSARCRNKSKEALQVDKLSEEDKSDICCAKDTVQDDSGVHSVTESHSNYPIRSERTWRQRYNSWNKEGIKDDGSVDAVIIPPIMRHKVKSQQGLPRSFSSQLSSLGPVTEGPLWDTHDDAHVDFKDNYGTAY